ncbi:TPA: 30S ribosomal protein S15 [Candidatus Micrarchaeota archaeon]|nr:MAG: 30S ribosomal protein S15 [Candidatus Micrarchaeota archaeon CG1_02_51_15]HII38520.1 30S ribosomal protein S15 [Candidatus Micrarchaeota archaeon]
MARMHSRKRGRSASSKPVSKTAPAWIQQSKEDVIALIEKFAKEDKTEAQMGAILRDQYGIPSVKAFLGKSISQVLEEKKLAGKYPSDLIDLIRKAMNMRKHLKENTRDQGNRTKLGHVESKIKRLVRYYRGKKLPKKWSYVPEEAALLVK